MINYVAQKQRIVDEVGRKDKFIRLRMRIVVFICFVGFVAVLVRGIYLHLADDDNLKWIAKKQYNANIPVSIRRGKVFDRSGAELAASLPVPSLYADPTFVENKEDTARKLSSLLGLMEDAVLSKLRSPRSFVWLRRRVSYQTLKKVMELNLPGVNYIEESKRFYPNGELASQILGAVGYDSQALAGMELAYSDVLVSKKKSTSYKRDARGRLYAAPLSFGEQSDVGEIYLTIDRQIQFIAESALRKAVEKYKPLGAMAVVIDPRNGEILAMANALHFDPNRYSKYPVDSWRNKVVTDAFEPGSTFKVLIVSAALDVDKVNAESVYFCENGAIKVGKDILKDAHPYGDLSVQDIIKYSSNIGALKVAFDLGKESLYKALRKFRIGLKTGIDYPGEAGGKLRDYGTWQPVEHATVAFGQGLTTTPLQMAAAFAAVVNGGIYYRPHLVTRVVERDGRVTTVNPEVVSHPISKAVSDIVRQMLRRVVEDGGTGKQAYSEAYAIGGKTGTGQKVVKGFKGYAKGRYFASFIGFAPVEDPKLVVFVGLDEPKGAYYGGVVAAPVVKEIIEQSLNYMGVPSVTARICSADEQPRVPVLEVEDVETKKRVEFVDVGKGAFLVPDLTGMGLREVLVAAGRARVKANTSGNGIAVKQDREPGTIIREGELFSVKFELPR